ncbi:hypothetical protein [Gordonia otitidis]|nr:hypothetical protein [Gordonia otitidis]
MGPDAQLDVIAAPEAPDDSNRRMYRFVERNPGGLWTVSVYAFSNPHSRDYQESLVVEAGVEAPDGGDPIDKVDPPRLIRRLLDAHEAKDATVTLTGSPELIRVDDVHRVVEAIKDPQRTVSVVVAPSAWREHEDSWRKVIESLTKQSVGIAATYVIDDAACAELNEQLPPSHRVALGSVRTYVPAVDISSPEDGLRHRILFPGALARSVSATRVARPLAKTHARSTRLRLLERDLPGDIRRGLEILHRAEVSAMRTWEVDRRVGQPKRGSNLADTVPVALDEAAVTIGQNVRAVFDGIARVAQRWLGKGFEPTSVDVITALDDLLERRTTELAVVEEQVDEATQTLESNEQSLRDMRTRLEDVSLDLTISDDRIRELTREAAQLRQRLVDAGRAEDAYVAPIEDLWTPPDDVLGLISMITKGDDAHRALKFVEFTGDEDIALEVDVHEKTPRYAHAFWDYVHVLYDYANGKADGSISCGVHMYLQSDHIAGHKCSPERHASTESDSVLNRKSWRDERMLPVPKKVDPSGLVLMDAHFKPTWRDKFAPRMHYFDDTNQSGKVYIGYIGRHLTNTKT